MRTRSNQFSFVMVDSLLILSLVASCWESILNNLTPEPR